MIVDVYRPTIPPTSIKGHLLHKPAIAAVQLLTPEELEGAIVNASVPVYVKLKSPVAAISDIAVPIEAYERDKVDTVKFGGTFPFNSLSNRMGSGVSPSHSMIPVYDWVE